MDEYQPMPVSRYIWMVLKDDAGTTFRGALVGNSLDMPFVELRGAHLAETQEGRPGIHWRPVDFPVIAYRGNINYLFDATPTPEG